MSPGGLSMEKKIARIYRWLERCAKACSAESWSSALLDMECAEAELEDVRSEIWTRAEGALPRRPVRRGSLLLRVSFLSVVLIFALAAPLAMQNAVQDNRSARSSDSGSIRSAEPALEWVTGDEQAVLSALRKSRSEANLAWVASLGREEGRGGGAEDAQSALGAVPRDETAGRRVALESGLGSRSREIRHKDASASEPRSSGRKSAIPGGENEILPSSPANELDSILALVQIGQKALRERESPIRFQHP